MIAIEKEMQEGFTSRYIEYCNRNRIDYILVDTTKDNFITQIQKCNYFLWHPHQWDPHRMLYALSLTLTLENAGIKVFPDSKTFFYFDDKISETLLLQMIEAPIVKSYVFFNQNDALQWAQTTDYPKVFKLRGGAGSSNVHLIKTERRAKHLIKEMFSTGIDASGSYSIFVDQLKKLLYQKTTIHNVGIRFKRLLREKLHRVFSRKEYGYAYFQDFIPNNDSDYRVIVIGNKAFSIRRMCRPHNFRASGSGVILFNKSSLNEKCVSISFDIGKRLKTQCIAFDFVLKEGNPLIVEISYGFAMKAYDACPGYWTDDMVWHEEKFNPQEWIIQNLLNE